MQETPKGAGFEAKWWVFYTLLLRPSFGAWASALGEQWPWALGVLGGHLAGGMGCEGPCSGSTQAASIAEHPAPRMLTCLNWLDGWRWVEFPMGLTGIEAGAGLPRPAKGPGAMADRFCVPLSIHPVVMR